MKGFSLVWLERMFCRICVQGGCEEDPPVHLHAIVNLDLQRALLGRRGERKREIGAVLLYTPVQWVVLGRLHWHSLGPTVTALSLSLMTRIGHASVEVGTWYGDGMERWRNWVFSDEATSLPTQGEKFILLYTVELVYFTQDFQSIANDCYVKKPDRYKRVSDIFASRSSIAT